MPRPFEPLTTEEFATLLDLYHFTRRIDAGHLHHTWRPTKAQYTGERTIEAMWRYHTQEKGWRDIAQHVSIAPDGTIWTGRDWNVPPASAVGYNGNGVAGPFMIEVIGDFDEGRDVLEGAQLAAVIEVIGRVQEKFGLPEDSLRFHNSMTSAKTCPGTSVRYDDLLHDVRKFRAGLASISTSHALPSSRRRAADERIRRLARGVNPPHARNDTPLEEAGELDESAMTIEQEALLCGAEQATRAAPGRRGTRGPGAELTPHMLDELRPHLVNLNQGRFSSEGRFRTSPGDVDAIFEQHLPRAREAADKAGRKLNVVFWAHGGLIVEEAGLRIAHLQRAWWERNGVYPIFFVWETGFLDALRQVLRGTREAARALRRDLFDWTSDPLLEDLAQKLGGGKIWSAMKRSAELASASDGGARYVADRLNEFCSQPANGSVVLHAVGHSAGSIFHAHFLPRAVERGVPGFASLNLLAPAIRVDLFKRTLQPLVGSGIGHLGMFTMKRDWEEADSVAIYRKSLLYLVSRALEAEANAPILGLEESVRADDDLRSLFGLKGTPSRTADVVWSVSEKDDGRSASTSRTHGGFDNDRATMNSVLRRVLGKGDGDTIVDFPAEAVERTIAATRWDGGPDAYDAAAAASGPGERCTGATTGARSSSFSAGGNGAGTRRALCIGIDEYSASPLAGCVADALLWGETLGDLGFDVTSLLNGEATRESIVAAVADLVRSGKPGDVLVLQFAGHGTLLDDLDGDEVGDNGAKDEALCPYDFGSGAFVIDDDLAAILADLGHGVNLTCFMDSCHSGTVTRLVAGTASGTSGRDRRARFLRATPDMENAHRRFRTGRGHRAAPGVRRGPATMREVLFSACLDREQAIELDGHGEFTIRATQILRQGVSGMTHSEFERQMTAAFEPGPVQHPQLDCAPAARERLLLGPLAAAAGHSLDGGNGGGPYPPCAPPTSNGILNDIALQLRHVADRLASL